MSVARRLPTTNRLMAVLDTDDAAAAAVAALAREGITGEAVLVLRGDGDARDRARRALAGAGAHFVNFFGRFATEDIVPWRGPELPLPPWQRR
jgi:hypothetical protein